MPSFVPPQQGSIPDGIREIHKMICDIWSHGEKEYIDRRREMYIEVFKMSQRKRADKSILYGLSLLDYVYKLYRDVKTSGGKLDDIAWDQFVTAVYGGVRLMLKEQSQNLSPVEPTVDVLNANIPSLPRSKINEDIPRANVPDAPTNVEQYSNNTDGAATRKDASVLDLAPSSALETTRIGAGTLIGSKKNRRSTLAAVTIRVSERNLNNKVKKMEVQVPSQDDVHPREEEQSVQRESNSIRRVTRRSKMSQPTSSRKAAGKSVKIVEDSDRDTDTSDLEDEKRTYRKKNTLKGKGKAASLPPKARPEPKMGGGRVFPPPTAIKNPSPCYACISRGSDCYVESETHAKEILNNPTRPCLTCQVKFKKPCLKGPGAITMNEGLGPWAKHLPLYTYDGEQTYSMPENVGDIFVMGYNLLTTIHGTSTAGHAKTHEEVEGIGRSMQILSKGISNVNIKESAMASELHAVAGELRELRKDVKDIQIELARQKLKNELHIMLSDEEIEPRQRSTMSPMPHLGSPVYSDWHHYQQPASPNDFYEDEESQTLAPIQRGESLPKGERERAEMNMAQAPSGSPSEGSEALLQAISPATRGKRKKRKAADEPEDEPSSNKKRGCVTA